jgi:hypothetical protein
MSGTKRVRVARASALGLITPQVIALYRHALELRARAHRSEADLDAFSAAEDALNNALRLRMCDVGIFEDFMFAPDTVPDYMPPAAQAGWYRTRELRRQLAEADHELRKQERAAGRAKATPEPEPETAPLSLSPDQQPSP